jgi:hypothetical protein
MAARLSPIFDPVDIDACASIPPERLILNLGLVAESNGETAAARALKYSRAVGDPASYDDIGFRLMAATPNRGPLPLSTVPMMRHTRNVDDVRRRDSAVDKIVSQQEFLRHRPIDLPEELDGRVRYEIKGKLIHIIRRRPGSKRSGDDEEWVFPLASPPQLCLQITEDRDEPLIFTQVHQANVPGAFWIPVSLVVESGRIRRMQEWREKLQGRTEPGQFYCFISHRWQTPSHPDPDGLQARFITWQLFSHVCDAVRVANARGLNAARKFSPSVGSAVGRSGSPLAEALIVNVLRFALDDEVLGAAEREARGCEEFVRDYGIKVAGQDLDLARLRGTLHGLPILSQLMQRIFIWYDYGAMPQPPRTPEEDTVFRAALEHLTAIQITGRTAILLDEVEDYLSRGWCTLESVVADTLAGVEDLLVGSARQTIETGSVKHYFDMLLQDRPHLIWRAVLDTEVFRVQTPEECLSRLGVAVTDPGDVPFIYRGLVSLNSPRKIHIDDSEIVTGVFPLPVAGRTAFIASRAGRPLDDIKPCEVLSLDWTGACWVGDKWGPPDKADTLPAWLPLQQAGPGERSCHVAVVASCEGEAVLMTKWIHGRLPELESLIETRVASISWLATDIAPVGHLVDGTLRGVPVQADVWVLAAQGARFVNCSTTSTLQQSIGAAKVTYFELSLDSEKDNLCQRTPPRARKSATGDQDPVLALDVDKLKLDRYVGGLFRHDLLKNLISLADDRGGR